MTDNLELKTIGFTPAIYLGNQAMFHVIGGVPIGDALSMASDFLCLAKSLTEMRHMRKTMGGMLGLRIISWLWVRRWLMIR